MAISILNIYDLIEHMRKESKLQNDDSLTFNISNLKRYTYILGALTDLKKHKETFEKVSENIQHNFQTLEESIDNFDESLETL